MCKRLICLAVYVLLLGLRGSASAKLVGYWKLDEFSGTVAHDSSGNGNDGTFQGGIDPEWVTGKLGGALEFDGVNDYVDCGNDGSISNLSGTYSIEAWVNFAVASDYPGLFQRGNKTTSSQIEVYLQPAANLTTVHNRDSIFYAYWNPVPLNEWTHVAVVWDKQAWKVYYNGIEQEQTGGGGTAANPATGKTCYIGLGYTDNPMNGVIDDVRIYDQALEEEEIFYTMEGDIGYPYALRPDPADGALYSDTWVTLSWRAGYLAVSHDVYLGDNFDDVNDGSGGTFQGNQVSTFFVAGFPGFAYPDGLVPGTTYYWRIDEVNEADPNSPWKGRVWSFSIPPKTAYNPNPADGAEVADSNSVTLRWTPGFGAKLHTVYFGDSYDEVSDAAVGFPAGSASYSPGPLEREKVYYWRVDEFDGLGTFKGDVWTFTTPGAVGNPQPVNVAADVEMNAVLSWTPADSAASHQLYLGTDKEAVRNADTSAPEYKGSITLGAENYDPGLLEAETTYYWRVDEVDDQGNTSKGPIWIFTTGAFLLVDDFEDYTDDDAAGEAIWQTWIDGFGVPDNGAQVGYLMPPYAEQTIVHGGTQSMPLLYINEAGVTNSEATMTLASPRDWTQAGVGELSLWFRGSSDNAAEPLYVAVSNSAGSAAVVAYDDAGIATDQSWTSWRIPLQAFADQGINLSDVDKIAIGLGTKVGVASSGGTGTVYVDDIRLY